MAISLWMGLLSELRLRSRTIRNFAKLVLLLGPGRLLPVRDPMQHWLAGGPSELTRSAPLARVRRQLGAKRRELQQPRTAMRRRGSAVPAPVPTGYSLHRGIL